MKTKKGFTIIEVVLVLAIAGLIFLMVFIALPALQRSQRDTQRRNDMARLATALTQYQANNGGGLPHARKSKAVAWNPANSKYPKITDDKCSSNAACKLVRDYMNPSGATVNEFVDPNGKEYNVFLTGIKADGTVSNPKYYQNTSNATNRAMLEGSEEEGYTFANTSSFPVIFVVIGAKCDGEKIVKAGDSGYAVMYSLEGAGVYCSDNS